MLRAIFSKPYSRLFIVGDNAGWVIDEEAKKLKETAEALGVKANIVKRVSFNLPQTVHYTSQFSLLDPSIYKSHHRISLDYFHGKPEHGESYGKCFKALAKNASSIRRIRVSNKDMEETMKVHGIDSKKIRRIPIGLDLKMFSPQTQEKKRSMRDKLGIPYDATVIGSFQKDGVGWSEGNELKFIKGPDIFLKVIEKLKNDIPNLWVLLSGPSRGFVKNGLKALGAPYRHKYFKDYKDIAGLYDALDLYLITSREEGGPKACLESMAKGVPLVTTAVGQCRDLVKSGVNAMMAEIDDADGLYQNSLNILSNETLRETLVASGFITAKENSYESQLPLWKKYLEGLIG